jgi:hypothetical protein
LKSHWVKRLVVLGALLVSYILDRIAIILLSISLFLLVLDQEGTVTILLAADCHDNLHIGRTGNKSPVGGKLGLTIT